jgi:lipoate-protein ligase A
MAIDEALLLSCDEQLKVTLRFYGWARPTLSLGYSQSVADVDLEECWQRGFEWIRRPTGGRAVLHDHELTYSVVAPIEVLGESVSRSHEKISRGLARGLEKLGLHAEFVQSRASVKEASAACFAAPAMVELTVQGKKVIGSAQMRTRKSLLQHGSIPIIVDFDALATVLKLPAAARLLRQKAAGLADFLAREPMIAELKRAFRKSFEEFFEVEFIAEGLSSQEWALADNLCTEKYSTSAWNWRA